LCFGVRTFLCTFILAAVSKPILGSDFLAAHRLLVDPFSRLVLDAVTLKPLSAAVAALPSKFAATLCHITPAVRTLLAAFPSIIGDGKATPRPLHGVRHSVETTGRPVFAKARRLDPEKLRLAEAEFRTLEKAGIIRRSSSPWSSPLHMVPKQDGTWRPCGDYRRLNLATKPDKYPLPSILDLSAKLHGCRYFSCIDLIKGYHQVPMQEEDIEKTAIITPFGLWEYLFMPFGLTNAAQTFQRLMDRLFRHLPFVFTYLDDHLIASRTLEEHLEHLSQFFAILQENGLTINPAKCVFAVASLKFLGHQVSAAGIVPLARHVTAIQEFPPPSDLKGLQRFLGMVNFYRQFLPSIAQVLQPLTDLLRGNPKQLLWSAEAAAAFTAAKAALVSVVPLSHPAPGAPISLAVDASDSHVGGVLQQYQQRGWSPLAFFSKKLSPTQAKYSTFDRELLAAHSAIRHFRFLLEGRQFRLLTDHKPLVAAMLRVSPPWSARQQRHLSYIAEFTSDIRHTSGTANIVADALSRPSPPSPPTAPSPNSCKPASVPVVTPSALPYTKPATLPIAAASFESKAAVAAAQPVDFSLIAAAQQSCTEVAAMRLLPSLSVVSKSVEGVVLLGDVSTGVFRPLVPPAFREQVFLHLHCINHPGIRASRRLVCNSFCWPHMSRDVTAWARSCLSCQKSKIHRHVRLQAAHIPVPSRRFAHLHVDLVGPLPLSSGFSYLFTMVDRTTRWPEAFALSSVAAADCAAALLQGWIQRFGVPSTITSDRGPQFTSQLWSALCKLLCINHIQTTAYHPQANGLVERLHRRLKDALRARSAAADWYHHLPWVMLGIRTAWREDGVFSPAENVFGSQPVLPGQFLSAPESPSPSFLSDFQGLLAGRTPLPTVHNSSLTAPVCLPEDLLLSRFVLVRQDSVQPPLSPLYSGPYLVLERSLHAFKLQIGDRTDTVSCHRLKACHTPENTTAAVPPRRGRPPLAAPCPPVPEEPARRRRVSFAWPPASSKPAMPAKNFTPTAPDKKLTPSSSLPLFHPSGRPARTVKRPERYA
jgi:cleavage and polyadenylation specificity factor subunit 1